MLKFCACALLAVGLFAGSGVSPSFAADAGKAQGALTLDKTATLLTNAYALEVVELPEMRVENAPERSIMLILTDRPLRLGRSVNDMTALEQAYQGQLRGLALDIDPATGKVLSGRTLIPQQELPQFFSVDGDPPAATLSDFTEDKAKGMITGKAKTASPMEVVNFDNAPGPKSFSFNVSFSTPVIPAPKLTATIEGDQAKASEQGQTLKRFLQAVAASDPDAIRAIVTKDHPALSMLDPDGLASIKAMIFSDGSSADETYAKLTKIYVFDKNATVLLRHPDGWSSYPLTLEGGKWKMGF